MKNQTTFTASEFLKIAARHAAEYNDSLPLEGVDLDSLPAGAEVSREMSDSDLFDAFKEVLTTQMSEHLRLAFENSDRLADLEDELLALDSAGLDTSAVERTLEQYDSMLTVIRYATLLIKMPVRVLTNILSKELARLGISITPVYAFEHSSKLERLAALEGYLKFQLGIDFKLTKSGGIHSSAVAIEHEATDDDKLDAMYFAIHKAAKYAMLSSDPFLA